jgi:hypothetical protein
MSTEYVGKMLDGQMHGHGKLIYENNEYYEGDFVRGKWSAIGDGRNNRESDLIILSSLIGKREGQGHYVYADTSTFKGVTKWVELIHFLDLLQ